MPRLFFWIDHTSRYDGNSGVQRVVRSLARALEAKGREIVYVSWDEAGQSLVRSDERALAMLARHGGPAVRPQAGAGQAIHLNDIDDKALKGAWLIVPEVTHASAERPKFTANIADYCRYQGVKTAFVFYDLIPLLLEGYEDVKGAHGDYVEQLALADLVLPISEHAGRTLREHWTQTLDLSLSILPEIKPILLGETMGDALRPAASPSSGGPIRIVSLGTIEPRKNQVGLLKAFNKLCARRSDLDLQLSVVGHLHPKVAAEFQDLCAKNPKVEWRKYIDDQEVAELYRQAAFSVFPSLEEGYGLPIVESLWFGRPCICADFGSMAEIARGGGCLVVDTRSQSALEKAIETLASDADQRARLAAAAASRRLRTWGDYAADVEAAILDYVPLRRVWYFAGATAHQTYNSGIQRVTRALGRALQQHGVDVISVGWDVRNSSFQQLTPAAEAHLARWNGPAPRPAGRLPEPEPGDWLIVPEISIGPGLSAAEIIGAARRKGMRIAYVFYDMIPLKLSARWPDLKGEPIYDDGVAFSYENFWMQMMAADAVLPISRAVSTELSSWLRREAPRQANFDHRITAVPLAGDFSRGQRSITPRLAGDAIGVLSVGTLEPRKNHVRLIQAFRAAAARPGAPKMKLVIAGSSRPYPDTGRAVAAAAAGADNIELVESADDEKLAQLYAEADFAAYASSEEGFGLPILESIWFGRACLCHNAGALAETAEGGGALSVDMTDEKAIADGLFLLASDRARLDRLTAEAAKRPVRTWSAYARDVLGVLGEIGPPSERAIRALPGFQPAAFEKLDRPLLSCCITTYNRAAWLERALKRLLDLARPYRDVIEVVVCDNASTDSTPDVLARMAKTESFRHQRNPKNVGMLGNLGATVRLAKGEYVWLLGDDDLLITGVIENVLEGILAHPESEMAYLNYAYTNFDKPEQLSDVDGLIASATAIAEGGPNRFVRRLREVASLNENFFTAIYACIFRRSHAVRAYTQNVEGEPFSTFETCIPSTAYAMRMMLDLPACWLGTPGIVVNMNVSWRKWVPVWRLMRMPELYDWAEREGMGGPRLETYRWSHCQGSPEHLKQLYFECDPSMSRSFDLEHYIAQNIHLTQFKKSVLPELLAAWQEAVDDKKTPPEAPDADVIESRFGL